MYLYRNNFVLAGKATNVTFASRFKPNQTKKVKIKLIMKDLL